MERFLLTLTMILEIYWCYHVWSESKEWIRDGISYFKDVWNYLDLIITFISQLYMSQFLVDMITNQAYFKITFVRTCGGMTLFLLWLKMFYWMRLFSETAYFIKLITSTIFDLRYFINIIAIIMAAFITIFYVFSCNLTDEERAKDPYLQNYTGIRFVDAMITVYFITVGEFYYDNYSKGPNWMLIWPMFIACNFLMAIVFMNMLIAMMAETFAQVNSTKLESEIEQNIALICDYQDLVDVSEKFANKKYIIFATPAVTDTHREVDLEEEIEDLGNTVTKAFNRKIDEVER